MRPYIKKEWCKNCILCVKFCPKKNLDFNENGIIVKGDCIGCKLCEMHCPDYAIEVK